MDMVPFARLMAAHRHEIAAVILRTYRPGAGGMRMYHPEWLKRVRKMCDREGILLIADKIATGFGRTGKLFACEHAGITADILCLGKALTSGTMTLSAAITTRTVAGKRLAMAKPVALCTAPPLWAIRWPARWPAESLRLLESGEWQPQVAAIEAQLQAELAPARGSALVADVRVLGAIGVVETRRPVNMAALQRFSSSRESGSVRLAG